jgi:hypothetical protein
MHHGSFLVLVQNFRDVVAHGITTVHRVAVKSEMHLQWDTRNSEKWQV